MAVEAAPEPENLVGKQLRFEGVVVRDHSLVLTGNIGIEQEMAKDMRVGQTVRLQVTGKVTAKTHKWKQDKDSGDKYVKHQVTLHLDWIEDEAGNEASGEADE